MAEEPKVLPTIFDPALKKTLADLDKQITAGKTGLKMLEEMGVKADELKGMVEYAEKVRAVFKKYGK